MAFLIWILLCILVGMWSSAKTGKGAFVFFASLFFSPIIGALIVLFSQPEETGGFDE